MKIIKFSIVLLLILFSIHCPNARESYDVFIKNLNNSLINYDVETLKKMFGNKIIVYGFGEDSYSLSKTNDYGGYSKKKGPLYNSLFSSKKMKNVFGYNLPCFAEAFKEQKKIVKSQRGKRYFARIFIKKYRYEFTIKLINEKFKIVYMQISEK